MLIEKIDKSDKKFHRNGTCWSIKAI